MTWDLSGGRWSEPHLESRPPGRSIRDADAPPVRLDDELGHVEAHAHAPVAFGGYERLEDLLLQLPGDTRAFIFHCEDYIVRVARSLNRNPPGTLGGLQGVADQVYQHLDQLLAVAVDAGQVVLHLHVDLAGAEVQVHARDGDRALHHLRRRDLVHGEVDDARGGELVHGLEGLEQVVDALRPDVDALQQVRRGALLLQLALDEIDADHHVAQVVRDAGGEAAHGAQPPEVEHLAVRGVDHRQRGGQLLGTPRQQRDQSLDGARLVDVLARLPHRLEDVLRLPRLLEEAEDAGAVDGADERGRVGEAGEHDSRDIGLAGAQLLEHLDAGHLRHALVGDDDVDFRLVSDLERLFAGFRLVDGVATLQETAQHQEIRSLVVHQQDAALARPVDAISGDERSQSFIQHALQCPCFDVAQANSRCRFFEQAGKS